MMKFWPRDAFEIETAMRPEEIAAALSWQVEPSDVFRFRLFRRRFPSDHAPFQGCVRPDGFKMTPVIHYGNSFLPVVRGKFLRSDGGTKVVIRLRLKRLVAVGMCVWLGGAGLMAAIVIALLHSGQIPADPMLLIPLGMPIFGWVFMTAAFWLEVKKLKPMLCEMFSRFETAPRAP